MQSACQRGPDAQRIVAFPRRSELEKDLRETTAKGAQSSRRSQTQSHYARTTQHVTQPLPRLPILDPHASSQANLARFNTFVSNAPHSKNGSEGATRRARRRMSQLPPPINTFFLTLKLFLVSILIVVAIISVPIISLPGDNVLGFNVKFFKHGLEWNYFIGVITFYLLTFFMWKKIN